MPVRDGAAFLPEALESLYAQDEIAWELVVVDDGSTDATASILARASRADRRIRTLCTHAGERGIVPALNLALETARGTYCARLDCDDLMHPTRLRSQGDALAGDPSLFAVTCRVEGFPTDALGAGMARYLAWQNALLDPHSIAVSRFIESPVLHPSVMLGTKRLRALGGWRDHDWPEDWDLFLRAFEAGYSILRVPETLYRWRQHPGQATRHQARYDEKAFARARAHYLARHLKDCFAGREIWILGAGPVGKRLGAGLAGCGAQPAGFADLDAKKIGTTVGRRPNAWPVTDYESLRPKQGGVVALAAVGSLGARDMIRERLEGWGWREGEDYLAAA